MGDVCTVLNEVLREDGIPLFEAHEVRALMGEGIAALVRKALRQRAADASCERRQDLTQRFLDLYCANPVTLTTAFPFALEAIAELTAYGLAVGVCTNKAERPARLILDRLGFSAHVQAVVGADSGFGRKPDPAPLLGCASKLGVPASRVVYVGDHGIDIETAKAAGVPVVAAAYGYAGSPAHELGADRIIACLSELPSAIRGLAGQE